MAEDDNIPTLTTVVQLGKEEMRNRFADHSLSTQTPADTSADNSARSFNDSSSVKALKASQADLRQQIDQAISEMLPEIESRLKKQLYKEFNLQ